jgi:hypothetical protein
MLLLTEAAVIFRAYAGVDARELHAEHGRLTGRRTIGELR